ncbi:MAG: helix-turn-helix transcriptional regulator [Kofleriaceae bacterium]
MLPAGLSVEAVELAGETFFLFSFESPGASELPPLTEAEQHVIELVLQGLRTREIATVRGSSHATVCSQLQSIYRKLGVVSRGELVALFA